VTSLLCRVCAVCARAARLPSPQSRRVSRIFRPLSDRALRGSWYHVEKSSNMHYPDGAHATSYGMSGTCTQKQKKTKCPRLDATCAEHFGTGRTALEGPLATTSRLAGQPPSRRHLAEHFWTGQRRSKGRPRCRQRRRALLPALRTRVLRLLTGQTPPSSTEAPSRCQRRSPSL